MNILTYEEYCEACEMFFAKYVQYQHKIGAINFCENQLNNAGKLTKELENNFEEQRQQLNEQYEGYTSIYTTNFGCYITEDNADDLLGVNATSSTIKCYLDMIGKKVQTAGGEIVGILKNIIDCPDDIYYEIQTDNGIEYETAVSSIKLFE